jgi:hypothetical protein
MAHRKLPGQADSRSREPERVQPVPEQYEGVNFPYRGIETHGVPVPENVKYDTREFAYPEEEPETPESALPEPDPVLVRVVDRSARERYVWRCSQFTVTEQAQQILGRHDKRRNVRIRNQGGADGGASVYIGYDDMVKTYTGYLIPTFTEIFPVTSTEEIWAVCAPGTDSTIYIMYEVAVEL